MSTDCRLLQCTELEYILLGDLRDLLEEPADAETARWMSAVLDALLDTLPEEFEIKSQDGYMREVLKDFPNWDSEVEKLEDEHYALYCQLNDLRNDLVSDDYSLTAKRLRSKLSDWMTAFRKHRSTERSLVLMAANVEIGSSE